MTMGVAPYLEYKDIIYSAPESRGQVIVSSRKVLKVVVTTNEYLEQLNLLFNQLEFNIFQELGQRNLSGFIGEVFARYFASTLSNYVVNPHADGRPDLLDFSSSIAREHFKSSCFDQVDGEPRPRKSALAPFKFGGLEVKTTIGEPVSDYRKRLHRDLGVGHFAVGLPRVDYLRGITFWGHHAHCANLLGLYYDYYADLNGTPQIIAVMHSELDCANDWCAVSTGRAGSKKTSNTSLSGSGRQKMVQGLVLARNHPQYLQKLRDCGFNV